MPPNNRIDDVEDFRHPVATDPYRGYRALDHDPYPYDPEFVGKTTTNYNATHERYTFPVNALETVIGVVAFNKKALYDKFGPEALRGYDDGSEYADIDGNLHADVYNWIMENGTVIFFNRYSGAPIKS